MGRQGHYFLREKKKNPFSTVSFETPEAFSFSVKASYLS
jgi:hypothetical protein